MLSAAAALVTTGAQAGTEKYSFTFGTSGGGSYCDGGTTYTSGASIWSWQHTNNNCASGVSYGQGVAGKKSVDLSDTYFGQVYGIFSEYLSYALPTKLKKKKASAWELYIGVNGTTSFLGNEGVLVNVDGPKGHAKGVKGSASNLKQLIALHKSSK